MPAVMVGDNQPILMVASDASKMGNPGASGRAYEVAAAVETEVE